MVCARAHNSLLHTLRLEGFYLLAGWAAHTTSVFFDFWGPACQFFFVLGIEILGRAGWWEYLDGLVGTLCSLFSVFQRKSFH